MKKVKDSTRFVSCTEIINLKNHKRFLAIDPEKVLFCKAEGSYTRVIIEDSLDVLVTKHLKTFQRIIPEEAFIRCHYSYLINIKNILTFDSRKRIIAFEGYYVPVSRRKANQIFNKLSNCGIQDVKNDFQI